MERIHHIYCLLTLLFLLGPMGSIHGQDNTMERDKDIVARQFKKWQNGEGSFFDLLAENAVWEVSGKSPVSGVYKSKSEFMAKAVNPIVGKLKSPLKPELISLSAVDSFVWLHFKASATTITGDLYENSYIWKMQLKDGGIIKGSAFLDTYTLSQLLNNSEIKSMQNTTMKTIEETKDYIGMWVTKDGHIRHELLPDNRYDEARGNRKSAYQGSYKVKGNHIDYKDDTGFTADGEFKGGILYHGGMIFYKEK